MSEKTLRIDIISDVVCPWCVIGYGRLKQALSHFTDTVVIDIHWHPFELNPNMPDEGENLRQHLANKYGTTKQQSIEARAMLSREGDKTGFQFNFFDEMTIVNTHNCHQLLLWADDSELQTPLAEALFAHYFSQRGQFDQQSLVNIAEQVGLDREQAWQILDNRSFSDEVTAIELQWHQKGVNAVPLFIFNNSQALSGAQPTDTFKNLIASIIKK